MFKEPAQNGPHTSTMMAIVDAAIRFHLQCHTLMSLEPVDLNKFAPRANSLLFDQVEDEDVNKRIKKWLKLADLMLNGDSTAPYSALTTAHMRPWW